MNAGFAWCRAACRFGNSLMAILALTGLTGALLPSAAAADFAVNDGSLNGGNIYVTGIAVDAAGNSYAAGYLDGPFATFGATTLTRIGTLDAFVVKRDASGTVLWAKNFGGSGASALGQSIAVDGSGNVLLGGWFGNANLTTPALTKLGIQDAFAFKLNGSDGSVTWAKNFGGDSVVALGNGIAADGSGNVLLGGWFFNANLTNPALTKIGFFDAFAFKLNGSDGNITWAKNFGGSGAFVYGSGIAADGSGNVLLGGHFNDANLTTPALTKLGIRDAFAFKLDSSGNTAWAKNFGGSGASALGQSIAVDGSGNVALGGYFSGANLTTPVLSIIGNQAGNQDAFALKLDSSGNTAWAKNFGGIGASAVGTGIGMDGSGNVYLGGNFGGANLTTPALTRIGSQDGFLIRLPAITVPGAPTIGTATAGNAQATVTFSAPGSNGGSAITGYTVTANPSGVAGTCANSPCTVTGLTNGTAYTFTVTATNSAGTGAASAPSNSVTPKAPQTITFAHPGDQIFGTGPTLTASASSGLAVSLSSSTTGVCTITTGGTLTFLATGTCSISANQIGNGAYTAAPQVTLIFSVNATVPGAPTIGTATAGNTQATVSFSAPGSNGGSAITGYTATSNPSGVAGTCANSPCTVTGLANGTAYTFTVAAINGIGAGAASTASNSVTPVFASQTVTFAPASPITFGITPITLTAMASSGLTAFTFSTSSANTICTVSGNQLTIVGGGTCALTAIQAGNANYASASANANVVINAASQTVTFAPASPVAFGVGTIPLTATATSGLLTFSYSTSSSASICGVAGNTLIILGGGTCGITATQAGNASYASASASANVLINPTFTFAQSRKTHGSAGIFDLTIDTSQTINGLITVEPRSIGSGHTIVFQFNGAVATPGTVSVTPVGIAGFPSVSGNEIRIPLTNVPDNQRVTVTLGLST